MVSSSSLSHIKRYHVFPSFHGPDVRSGFISHLHHHFTTKGITTFMDQKIERGHTIGPKQYASSSWCLDELVEIFRCKEDQGQIVMTVFYKVDPSDVRKQRGDFRNTFEKTCQGKTEEEKKRWSKALAYAATVAGEHSLNWANEAEMIQKIATDVSNKLNVTPSRDFDGMVGLEAHLTNLSTLLCLECDDDVKMIGIWGPAGIGKSTIARALYNQLARSFSFLCFMGNLKGSYKSIMGVDDYDSKLCLQNQLLSKILNRRDMRVHHLGAIKEWLQDQRVFIILDDVDDIEKLEVLAKEPSWFGSGSRIIVTTEDKKILKAHGIDVIYNVDFPSEKEALEILCLSAFKQSSVRDGFEELANRVVKFCGSLPLGLRVVGSSLRGESEDEWRLQLHGIETSLDRKIEDVLRVGYDRLSEKYQDLFLHIACCFNYKSVDYVTTMLADSILDVRNGLKTLAVKSLVHISTNGSIKMHSLLQQLGRDIVVKQSSEPGKRQFLVEAEEIRDVLANETGTGSVLGISFDDSKFIEFSISGRAFEGMPNLKYLRFNNANVRLLEDMEYLPRVRLLHWPFYPRKCLPLTFQPERLVELYMPESNLEKLWGGIQPLPNLKKINLSNSLMLKEVPNLSNATNLETLILTSCTSLVEVPSSIRNLHRLKKLKASGCIKLEVVPKNINLASLEEVDMSDCSRLRSLPNLSRNIKILRVGDSKIEEFPASIVEHWSRLEWLDIGTRSLKRLTHVPLRVTWLVLKNCEIETIPECGIGFTHLQTLIVENCTKLVSIQGHFPSLDFLCANHCVSLKRVCCSVNNLIRVLIFYNCSKLDEEARRGVIQHSVQNYISEYICLPGKEVLAEFTHKATGNSIAICLNGTFSASLRFKACLVLSPLNKLSPLIIFCHIRGKGGVEINRVHRLPWISDVFPPSPLEHLFIFCGGLFHEQNGCLEVDETTNEILFEFDCWGNQIMECGVQILLDEGESSSSSSSEVDYYKTGGNSNHHTDGYGDGDYESKDVMVSKGENLKSSTNAGCWSWLRKLHVGKKTEPSSRPVSGSSDGTENI